MVLWASDGEDREGHAKVKHAGNRHEERYLPCEWLLLIPSIKLVVSIVIVCLDGNNAMNVCNTTAERKDSSN